jgi:hypothetical protein
MKHYQRLAQTVRSRGPKSVGHRREPEASAALSIHISLEAWFHRPPVTRSEKGRDVRVLQFHTRKV